MENYWLPIVSSPDTWLHFPLQPTGGAMQLFWQILIKNNNKKMVSAFIQVYISIS